MSFIIEKKLIDDPNSGLLNRLIETKDLSILIRRMNNNQVMLSLISELNSQSLVLLIHQLVHRLITYLLPNLCLQSLTEPIHYTLVITVIYQILFTLFFIRNKSR
jgi:hypothetical protein